MPRHVTIPGRGTFAFPDTMSRDDINEYIENELQFERQSKITHGPLSDVAMGLVGGAARAVSPIAKGLAWGAEQLGATDFGDYMRDLVRADEERLLGIGPEMPGSTAAQVGKGLGTTGALMGIRAIPAVGPWAAAGLGGALGAEEQRERQLEALASGEEISPEKRFLTQLGGAAIGTLAGVPMPGGLGKLRGVLGMAGKEAVEETAGGGGAEAGRAGSRRSGTRRRQAVCVRKPPRKQRKSTGRTGWSSATTRRCSVRTTSGSRAGARGRTCSSLVCTAGSWGGVLGTGAAGLGRHIARGKLADLDAWRAALAPPAATPAAAAAAPYVSPQRGLFGAAAPAAAAAPATSPMEDLIYGGAGEPTEAAPFGASWFRQPGEEAAAAAPAGETPAARRARITEEEAEKRRAQLETDEPRYGDVRLNFESPLDRAAYMGAQFELGTERRAEHLGLRCGSAWWFAARGAVARPAHTWRGEEGG